MLDVLIPMTSVLASWLLLFFMFSGLGSAMLMLIGRPCSSNWLWQDAFWLGWALTLGILQLWHFLFPVDDMALLLLAAIAASAMAMQRRLLVRTIRNRSIDKPFVLIMALLALWMSNRALGMPVAYDTGFRDMQAVIWTDSYPLTPGLGNLFSSLAFNQSVYLYDALLDASIWSGRSNYIATGLLVFAYLAFAAKSAHLLCRCRELRDMRWSWIFATLTAPYVFYYTSTWGGITHFLTDNAVELVGFVSVIFLLDFLQYWRADRKANEVLVYRLAVIVFVGFTIKQSFIVFGITVSAFACLVMFQRSRSFAGGRQLARVLLSAALIACAFLMPWVARGVITSGYIGYPLTFGRVELDWTIPEDDLRQRQLNLSTNTRLRGGDQAEVLASWDWLGPWLTRFAGNFMPTLLPTLIAVAAIALHTLGRRRHVIKRLEARMTPWTLAPMLAALMVWFLTYPEPKYARFLLWSVAALAVITALQTWQPIAIRRWKFAPLAVAAACIVYVLYLIVKLGAFPLQAGPERGFHAHPPARYSEFVTTSGLTLNVPVGDALCWRIPLPCTPYPSPNLEARVAGQQRHGFRLSEEEATESVDA